MQGFNEGEFNRCEFNAPSSCLLETGEAWFLYLNPGDPVLVGNGFGSVIPLNIMFPGQRYRLVKITGSETVAFIFQTPPAVTYDSLGG